MIQQTLTEKKKRKKGQKEKESLWWAYIYSSCLDENMIRMIGSLQDPKFSLTDQSSKKLFLTVCLVAI